MSRTEDQPWSPFPVQDWSSLPHDPLAGSSVDPSWAPPRPPRRWWPPLVVFLLVGALVGGASFAWSTSGRRAAQTAATRYLPPDGAAAYERVETTQPTGTSRQHQVTESARFTGITGLLSTDTAFGTQLLRETVDEAETVAIWRTTSSVYDDPAAPYLTTRAYRTTTAVELLGESRPDGGFVYRPALVELPADVVPGSTWTGAGSANDTLDYAAAFRAEAAGGDCLAVTGELRMTSKQGQPARTVALERTWCRGRGLVASSERSGDATVRVQQDPGTPPRTPPTTGTPLRWSSPESWTSRTYDTRSIDPTFGEEGMNGSPKALAPVLTESGLVVRAVDALHDLVGLTPKTRTTWAGAWRAHVAGDVLSLRAFGNVVLVTTSARQLVAYSDLGIRLWQRDLDEIAAAPPVRASATDLVVVDLAGVARRLRIGTGEEVWRHDGSSDVVRPPAVQGGLVVVLDRGGTVTALDEATGERRWDRELDGLAAGLVGDVLVVLQDQTAHGLDPATGETRWLRPFSGTVTELVGFGNRLVLATKTATVLLDDAGRITGRLPGYLRVTVAGERMIGWGAGEAEVVDRSGAVTDRWPLPELTLASQDRLVVGLPEGALLVGPTWTFTIWADER